MNIYSFLFDNYGLYPNDIIDNSFILDDYLYKLEEVKNYNEDDFKNIEAFSIEVKNIFENSFKLIKNRSNNYISTLLDKKYVLISILIYKITPFDIIKFNNYFINSKNVKYTISEMINIWVERFENIKQSCFKYLDNLDVNYNDIHTSTSFSFGLANNAISYLADTKLDYGDNIERLTLTHIRLNSMDSYSFFNPLNMIYDTLIRDYAELYKFDLIDIYELNRLIDKLSLTQKEASLLMARIMYPTKIFDLLEDNYLNEEHKINMTIDYFKSMDKELQRIKNVHTLLKRKYNIRPIKWLEK